MSVLNLKNIVKYYKVGDEYLPALKGVSLSFEKTGFVSILGPSGCGKTTLLNIIGGLDRYSDGDLIIGGTSSKKFKASDWDAYRNHRIGFVFQSYNLISHQTVLQNVEISLSLSGISSKERKARAKKALEDVGLGDQLKKKPSQLSGGQMQRVAIARALVNNPDIILADEPTGALDTQTSVNLMNLLSEIAKDKLIIMVTHNGELAETYSTRIIKLLDGEVLSDTEAGSAEKAEQAQPAVDGKKKKAKSAMSFITALGLSFKNLLTKKGRTLITSFAGSIGIISVALVLALSGGLTSYMGDAQTGALSGFPITINSRHMDLMGMGAMSSSFEFLKNHDEYPEGEEIFSYEMPDMTSGHENKFSDEYFDFIEEMKTELSDDVLNISYKRDVGINFMLKGKDGKAKPFEQPKSMGNMAAMAGVSMSGFSELTLSKRSLDLNYDIIGGRVATEKNEIMLFVDEYNAIDSELLKNLELDGESVKFSNILDKELLRVAPNDEYYKKTQGGIYTITDEANHEAVYENALSLEVVGILRPKEDASGTLFGFCYLPSLTDYVFDTAKNSQLSIDQKDAEINLFNGMPFRAEEEKKAMLATVGAEETPSGISIYPKDFESKKRIKEYLDKWNVGKEDKDTIKYSDVAESITSTVSVIINVVSAVLVGFSSISLIVSTIMIGIITYISVLERTREIGILRAVGARKKDISRVFNAETLIIGLIAGTLGVGLAYLLSWPINVIIENFTNIGNICNLSPLPAIILVAGSMLLTLLAGTLPAGVASRKDPVAALRSE